MVARIGQEDVYHHRAVVHRHPQRVVRPHHGGGLFPRLLAYGLLHAVGYGTDLLRRIARTDNEITRRSGLYGLQVGRCYTEGFLLLHPPDNCIPKFLCCNHCSLIHFK